MTEAKPVRTAVTVTPATSWNAASTAALGEILREDARVHGSSWFIPGLQALAVHRFAQWAYDPHRNVMVGRVAVLIYRTLYAYVRNVLGFEIPPTVKIGRRVHFFHQHGIAIHPQAEIGDECLIRHGTTIGLRWDGGKSEAHYAPPRLGLGVELGVACAIIGGVQIGDRARIAPHAVVTTDVPENASVVAAPSRVLRLH